MAGMLRSIVSLAVPTAIAVAAFLHAQAIGALVDSVVFTAPLPSAIAPFAEAHAAPVGSPRLAAFDPSLASSAEPGAVPPCDGVRAVVAVQGETQEGSLAALAVGQERLLRGRGGKVGDREVVFVGRERVWLRRAGEVCQVSVFAGGPGTRESGTGTGTGTGTAVERRLAARIEKTGAASFAIDRGALAEVLEPGAELSRTSFVPDPAGGFRVGRVKAGSAAALAGLETGDRLTAVDGRALDGVERVLELYGRLKTGNVERMTLTIVRGGTTTNLDYVVR